MAILFYNRSCYSLLESCTRVEQLLLHAQKNAMNAIAICDNNLFGAMSFYKKAKTANIKPIIGLKVRVEQGNGCFDYLIYAKDNVGYVTLMKLSSLLTQTNAPLTFNQLCNIDNHCAVICCSDGYPAHLYNEQNEEELDNFLKNLKENFYIGLNGNSESYNRALNNVLLNKCNLYHVRTIALDLTLYACKEDEEAYRTLAAIGAQTTIADTRLVFKTDAYLKTNEELKTLFDAQSLKMTQQLADEIDLFIDAYRTSLPKFPAPSGLNSKQYLNDLCMAGLRKRLNGKINKEYHDRLVYELSIITKMNYEEYFLIIYDFILYARRNNIYVGPGRGSAVGSLVAYCLGITHLDPIKYGLIFERFLNPERISMPDIDVDFPDDRREEVINYVREKYGEDRVGHIITFGTFAAKQVLRDVAKALNIADQLVDILLKNVERAQSDKLGEIYKTSDVFARCINSSDANRKLMSIALKLEGLPRHVSVHAAGIVMSEKQLSDVIPTIPVNGCATTQYTMEYLEELGLIKMDFLSLRNLSVIAQITAQLPDMNIMHIPLNDEKTFKLISSTDVNGIFQIEQQWVRDVIRQYQPTRFEDIAAIIALCRPGSMDQIPQYIKNKNNPSAIVYPHPDLKTILQETYGIIIYQEQIMQIAQRIAGFTLGKADTLRKAISKKKAEMMAQMREEFIDGTVKNGYTKQLGEDIYNLIEKFADYGFNKSHAIAYALIAYQQAYLKANYPLQFYCALLNNSIGAPEKISSYIIECRGRNIAILPPDLNQSKETFTIEENNIRMPLNTIKNISNIVAGTILKRRESDGLFKDYLDAVARLNGATCNKRVFESLIKAGAMDCFKLTHATMLNNLEESMNYGKLCQIEKDGQITIDLGLVSPPVLMNYGDNNMDKINDQYEMLGLYLYNHPIAEMRMKIQATDNSTTYLNHKGMHTVLGVVDKTREHRTKNGEIMCFVSCTDEFGPLEMVFMPKLYAKTDGKLKKGCILYIKGETGDRNSILVNDYRLINGGKMDE